MSGAAATALRGRVVTPDTVLADGVVAFEGARITWVGPARDWAGTSTGTGAVLLPGLVDIHSHGGGGASFGADPTAAETAVHHHRRTGTTTQLASLVSAPIDTLVDQVSQLADLVEAGALAGIHLEGPFLSVARCGAHDPALIIPGDPRLLEKVLVAGRGAVRSATLAPETAHAGELAALLREHGAIPFAGHTDADAATTNRVVGDGFWGTTHLFNAMPQLHHRNPGPVAACLSAARRGQMVLELIGDGVHLADETVRMVFDLVGPQRVALVTDAMAAAGMADGDYTLGRLRVRVTEGVARLAAQDGTARLAGETDAAQEGAIAGGTATLLGVVRRAVHHAGVDLHSAVTAATATPAAALGLDAGRLAVGAPADLLVVNDALAPLAVWRRGHQTEGSTWKS